MVLPCIFCIIVHAHTGLPMYSNLLKRLTDAAEKVFFGGMDDKAII